MQSQLRLLALCAGLVVLTGFSPPEPDSRSWHRTIGLLQYLQSDYPEAARTHNAFELQEQRALFEEAKQSFAELGPRAQPLLSRLEALGPSIDKGEGPEAVRRSLGELVDGLTAAGQLSRAPRGVPDLKVGATLFQAQCASCHGATGRGDGPIAVTLKPAPANFHSAKAKELTPYQIYNTVQFGIPGTAMPPVIALSEDERWAVAFYVSALRQPPCQGKKATVSLDTLANRTDAQLAEQVGWDAVSCLRTHLEPPGTQMGLEVARDHVRLAVALARMGDKTAARQAIVDAYLEGIEPIEPRLRVDAPEEIARVEASFLRTRLAAERSSEELDQEVTGLLASLDALEHTDHPASTAARFTSIFWMAMLIVVREGFEATLVVAALLAVLKKLGQESLANVVHGGWSSALLAGALSFFAGQKLLVGANREWMEGIVSLLATGMLLYAALWLNARAHVSRYMGELRARTQGALGQGSAIGLFVIAFSAVFRECFETALFLEGLALDSPSPAMWGALAGLLLMAGVVWMIRRIGFRLPMKPLFKASTVLLIFTAVVMLGKGIHALQEVGAVPLKPIAFITLEALGIFPDLVSTLGQALLILLAVIANWRLSGPRKGAKVHPTPGPVLPGGAAGNRR